MPRRIGLLMAVAAGHVLLAWMLARAFGRLRMAAPVEPVLTYVWLPSPVRPAQETSAQSARSRTRGKRLSTRASPQAAEMARPEPPRDPDFAAPITLPSTDWRGAAGDAARQAARLDAATRPPAPSTPHDKTLPWQEPQKHLIPKNGLLDLSLDRHGVDLKLFDHCVIHDLLAFGCRFGPKPDARGDLFDGMREQLDRRATAPLP